MTQVNNYFKYILIIFQYKENFSFCMIITSYIFVAAETLIHSPTCGASTPLDI